MLHFHNEKILPILIMFRYLIMRKKDLHQSQTHIILPQNLVIINYKS